MSGSAQKDSLSNKQKFAFAILVLFFSLTCSELALRARGSEPLGLVQQQYHSIEPGGKFLELNSSVGYSLLPGAFTITFIDGYTFQATHSSQRLRITHPLSSTVANKDEIWVFGDSFTYGWELNDDETYPWLLQKALPEFELVNFGVPGNGTVQSYLQFQDALKQRKKLKLVILAYASFHDERNTLTRQWRKYFPVPVNNGPDTVYLPIARLDDQGNAVYDIAKLEYKEFPFVRSLALANLIDNVYNLQVDARLQPSHQVSKAVIRDFSNAAKQNGVKFILAGIYPDVQTMDMLKYGKEQRMETIDISVPVGPITYFPDAHPRANANILFAQKLQSILSH